MHNTPHTAEAKKLMSLNRTGLNTKYNLPELEIVYQLLNTKETTRSLAVIYNCSDATIKTIFRKHTTSKQRLDVKIKKQSFSLKNNGNAPRHIGLIAKRMKIWNGRKHNKDSKEKQSIAKKGKKHSLEVRIKNSCRMQGIKIEDWKGFSTTEECRQRKWVELKNWRLQVFNRDNFICKMCGKKGGKLQAHHIKKFSKFPLLRFDLNNGITLCADPCHKMTIGKEESYESILFEKILN